MQAIDHLRQEIKNHFPHSKELALSSRFALNRQFNFYFEIAPDSPYLLYLNWDGDGIIYILKCLVFKDNETLSRLKNAYPETGSSAFNEGKPRTTITFRFHDPQRLYIQEVTGECQEPLNGQEVHLENLLKHMDTSLQKLV
ncbi:hypothetical protein CLV98_103101 [Dyadobacter jejuensis]|uniref:Uncharacterized protein n=1 Tax=Dyadobacter jejuensis TaxID=1082580 RepID=A0A316ALR3_9BACT|nr:hypothetical protein [Dyadobacter jejuensis]PWJ58735.1 hypothetical protein CLV98_103101 [Dyadobacter jejuensis]